MSNNNNPPNGPLSGRGNPPQNPSSFADKARIIIAGFIGGLMTPMIQPLQEFLRSHRFPSEFGLGYWFVGVALGVLGAVMVWLLKETDVKKALALGVSLPAFFISLGGAVQNSSAPVSAAARPAAMIERGATGIASLFVTTAYAQGSPSPSAISPMRSLKVNRSDPAFAYTLEILDARQQVISTTDVKAADPSPMTLPLPDGAKALRITAGAASSTNELNATPGQIVEVSLRGESFRRRFNVAQVFGKAPDFVPDKILIELKTQP